MFRSILSIPQYVKVKYHVEPARVGQSSQYEKLTLEIWTNGTVSPVDALSRAAEILSDHLDIFIGLDEATAPVAAEQALQRRCKRNCFDERCVG